MQMSVNDFKPGITFEFEGEVFVVLSSYHSKQARSSAIVKTKIKNLRNGTITIKTFGGGERVLRAYVDKKLMNFLYKDEDFAYLMDEESFEQVELPIARVEWELNFLKENSRIMLRSFKGEVLDLELPLNVELEVIEAPEAVRGNSTSNPSKKIKLETGFELEAPIFVKEGDIVTINTSEGKYVSRQNKTNRF